LNKTDFYPKKQLTNKEKRAIIIVVNISDPDTETKGVLSQLLKVKGAVSHIMGKCAF